LAGAGKEGVPSEASPRGIDNIFRREVQSSSGRAPRGLIAVDAAGEKRRKGNEWLLLRGKPVRHPPAPPGGDGLSWPCAFGDDSAGSLPGAWLLTNRGDVDGAVGGDGERK